MTSAKTCHACNMMQDFVKSTYCNQKHYLNRDVSMFHYCTERKLNLILTLKVAMLNE